MTPTLHQQNGFIYLMFNQHTLRIYTDIDRAKEGLIQAYKVIKGAE